MDLPDAMATAEIANISTYKFAPLSDLSSLRQDLVERSRKADLKGTILLSLEGINLFVAGPRTAVDALVSYLRTIPGLEDLKPKFSNSKHQPFNRMLVRIKKEIIAFGIERIDPGKYTSPRITPQELKRWLDEGRPVTLLDTRNDYEIKLGTFANAVPAGINHFRDFPKAVAKLPEALRDQPIVTFCTGGIRCEKAAPFMEMKGFRNVYQLDGGILKYFEECGAAHYEGECFVFDQRVGVDPALKETDSRICYKCLAPLTPEEQQHPHYIPSRSCPHCYQDPDETQQAVLKRRNEALKRAATPLPGSTPYENRRPLNVPGVWDGQPLIEFLCGILGHRGPDYWIEECQKGRLRDEQGFPLRIDQPVQTGKRCYHHRPASIEPDVNGDIRILYEDEALIILHKPAPLPMHPGGRYNRNTLVGLLHAAYAPVKPRPAHRLDANTSGILVCARTSHIARIIQPVFATDKIRKTYLARVHGKPVGDTFVCDAPIGDEPVKAGYRTVDPENGRPAHTEFEVLSYDTTTNTTLLEARPVTGRTNQIRIHLQYCGHPIVGDPAYLADGCLGTTQTLSVTDAPLCLHAWKISLPHPLTQAEVTFEAPPPDWAASA